MDVGGKTSKERRSVDDLERARVSLSRLYKATPKEGGGNPGDQEIPAREARQKGERIKVCLYSKGGNRTFRRGEPGRQRIKKNPGTKPAVKKGFRETGAGHTRHPQKSNQKAGQRGSPKSRNQEGRETGLRKKNRKKAKAGWPFQSAANKKAR